MSNNDKFIVKIGENMFEEIADTNPKRHVCHKDCEGREAIEKSCTGEIKINIKYERRCDNILDDIHEEIENTDSVEGSSSEYEIEGSIGKTETDNQSTDLEKSEDEINETEYDFEEDEIGDVPTGGVDYEDYNENFTDDTSKKEVTINSKIDYFEDIKQKVFGERTPDYISLLGPDSLKSDQKFNLKNGANLKSSKSINFMQNLMQNIIQIHYPDCCNRLLSNIDQQSYISVHYFNRINQDHTLQRYEKCFDRYTMVTAFAFSDYNLPSDLKNHLRVVRFESLTRVII